MEIIIHNIIFILRLPLVCVAFFFFCHVGHVGKPSRKRRHGIIGVESSSGSVIVTARSTSTVLVLCR